jgi:ABC-type sugar transport system ATPase subunit
VSAPALEVRGLGHRYGESRVLDDVTLTFASGRVHALIGRNGAGKSTLLRALCGAIQPLEGEIRVAGAAVRLGAPQEAVRHGIATVHQELTLVPELTVAENILLDRLPRRSRWLPLLDHRAARAKAAEALGRLGSGLDPAARVASLSFAERQLVEIARAIAHAPKVLLLDEPTSALSGAEVTRLIALVRALAAEGVAVVHVTHRLDELPRIADDVSVLRDGRLMGSIAAGEARADRLVPLMFGEVEAVSGRAAPAAGPREPVLVARDMGLPPRLNGVSLEVAPGEIVGVAGLVGSGRTELVESIFGARRARGSVSVGGCLVPRPSPRSMAAHGVALIPEDRKHQGLALLLSVADNAALVSLPRGFLTRSRVRDAVRGTLARLSLSAPSLDHPVEALSGGNQQKVVVGKWLLTPKKVLLLDEPTRGIDLAARRQLVATMRKAADEGMAVVWVSSELEELHETADRIVVMVAGRAVAEVDPRDTSLARLFALAMGEAA